MKRRIAYLFLSIASAACVWADGVPAVVTDAPETAAYECACKEASDQALKSIRKKIRRMKEEAVAAKDYTTAAELDALEGALEEKLALGAAPANAAGSTGCFLEGKTWKNTANGQKVECVDGVIQHNGVIMGRIQVLHECAVRVNNTMYVWYSPTEAIAFPLDMPWGSYDFLTTGDGGKGKKVKTATEAPESGDKLVASFRKQHDSYVTKATAKAKENYVAALTKLMDKTAAAGKLEDAASIQRYVQQISGGKDRAANAPADKAGRPAGKYVETKENKSVVEFSGNRIIPRGVGQPPATMSRVSPDKQVWVYCASGTEYIVFRMGNNLMRVYSGAGGFKNNPEHGFVGIPLAPLGK